MKYDAEFWANAPEGATHYGEGRDFGYWVKQAGSDFYFMTDVCGDSGLWRVVSGYYFLRGLVERPSSPPAYTGEGLPAVGVVCEIKHESWPHSWAEAKIKYASSEYIITEDLSGEQHWHTSSVRFRPLKTPEQKAAEEREAAVREMLALYIHGAKHDGGLYAIYDAGYRKQ